MAMQTKEELITKVAQLETEVLNLQKEVSKGKKIEEEFLKLKKSNEEIVSNEHNIRTLLDKKNVELDKLLATIKEKEKEFKETIDEKEKEFALFKTGKEKQVESLKADLTKLANLFDEYINAYQDQVKMLGVFVKNTQTVEKYLSGKIEEYNGGSK
jgi:chromosome segregation ATPase